MKKSRVLIASCSVILLCMSIIIGMTFALFTDNVWVKNHLKSGNLKVTLTRTNLEYSVLDNNGKLATITNSDEYDFTNATDENVFGINDPDTFIAPGSYFDATMKITNMGNVAFTYSVSIKLIGDVNALAEQLKVTITHPDGSKTTKMLSELPEGLSIATGIMNANDTSQNFNVRVEFVDYGSASNINNNDAQSQYAKFDLIVTAVQATTQD